MPIYDSVVDTIGATPLIRLQRLGQKVGAHVLGKMESRNPCSSIKDRVGVAMIRDAERRGELKPGAVIVEATSGNTGIALAFAAAALGYRLIITMPENMSRERIVMLRMFGAKVVLTRGGMMREAVSKAKEILSQTPGAVSLEQFRNPANPEAHAMTTAREILADTDGQIGAFVAGVGTGGTISGVGRVLKDTCPEAKIVAVEPAASAVLSGKPAAPHFIQGIGAGFVPDNLDVDLVDEIIAVSERGALDYTRRLAREEGIMAGISSGAAVAAAMRVARRADMKDKNVVVILPDTGERYLSTALVEDLLG
ncbi:MAG: cysteine synthase A [Haliangiales bacterium]